VLGSTTGTSNFFRMRRTSMKISAVIVQIKQPNMTRTGSIDGGLPSRGCISFKTCNSSLRYDDQESGSVLYGLFF
jgi:hypothetical protein